MSQRIEENTGGRHEHSDHTDRDNGAAELAVLLASYLVRSMMTGLFSQAGGAFQPLWWIPAVRSERTEV